MFVPFWRQFEVVSTVKKAVFWGRMGNSFWLEVLALAGKNIGKNET